MPKIYHGYTVYENGDVVSPFLTKKKLSKYVSHDGYITHVLRINKKSVRIGLHRLIAECYIPNPDNKSQVNHIDGNKKNNLIENLEWNTGLENQHHAVINGLSSRGTKKRSNTSGYVGVTYCKQTNKWISQIKINYKNIKIGRFKTKEEARDAYIHEYNKHLGIS